VLVVLNSAKTTIYIKLLTARCQLMLPQHKYTTHRACYIPAFTGRHCTYLQRMARLSSELNDYTAVLKICLSNSKEQNQRVTAWQTTQLITTTTTAMLLTIHLQSGQHNEFRFQTTAKTGVCQSQGRSTGRLKSEVMYY